MESGNHEFDLSRRKFHRALAQVAEQDAGLIFLDEDMPARDLSEAMIELCSSPIVSREQLDMLYEVIDYSMNVEQERVEIEIECARSPFASALIALAGHVLAERRRQSGNA